MSSIPEYKYSPLSGRDWTRLLRLDPQANNQSVATSLVAAQLDSDAVPYTSLSHSWGRNKDGDASLARSIIVNGSSLDVTENLHDCLIRLSPGSGGTPLLLWVDAVCINQTDVDERNSQVAMMAEVYKRASSLVIWLGEDHESDDDRLAMEALAATKSWDTLKR